MPHEGNGGPAEGTAEARLRVRVAWSSLKASLAEQAGERGMQGQSIHPWRHRESDFKNYYFLKKDCIIYFYFLGVSVLPAPVTIMCMQFLQKPEEGVRYPQNWSYRQL